MAGRRLGDGGRETDEYVARLETLAVIQTLNSLILSTPSATSSLESWCHDHEFSEASKITANMVEHMERPLNQDQIQRLQVSSPTAVKFRHVYLNWGETVVSEAYNWYVPGRLTDEMNHLLESTDMPFGKVAKSLRFYRQTFSVRLLWSPLPNRWEMMPRNRRRQTTAPWPEIPNAIFEHRATLFSRQHEPVSEVWEVYRGSLLNFRPAA